MAPTDHVEKSLIYWRGQSDSHERAFAMAYLMGQGDALRGLDSVLESAESLANARECITSIIASITKEFGEL